MCIYKYGINSTVENNKCICKFGFGMTEEGCKTYTEQCQDLYGSNFYGDFKACYKCPDDQVVDSINSKCIPKEIEIEKVEQIVNKENIITTIAPTEIIPVTQQSEQKYDVITVTNNKITAPTNNNPIDISLETKPKIQLVSTTPTEELNQKIDTTTQSIFTKTKNIFIKILKKLKFW